MKPIIYLCAVFLALTVGVVVWKWSSIRGSGLATSGAGKGTASQSQGAEKPAEQNTIHRGDWTTVTLPDGTSFRFVVKEFASYQSSSFKNKLSNQAAILVEFAAVKQHVAFDVTQTSAYAQLLDGSTATLTAFRPFTFDPDIHSLRTGTISTNKIIEETTMIEGTSRIGTFSAHQFTTFVFNKDIVFSFQLNGTNSLTLGLIFDAPFTDAQTITVFGKKLK